MGHRGGTLEERWQNQIAGYANRLIAAAQSSLGYAGGEFTYETREIVIFGVGSPTELVTDLIRDAPSGLRVTWQKAPFSQTELTAEVKRLMHEESRFRLSIGGARHDGTCIDLTTTDNALLASDDPRTLLGARYPVTVNYGEPIDIRDSAPF